jgi:hypothetical protein
VNSAGDGRRRQTPSSQRVSPTERTNSGYPGEEGDDGRSAELYKDVIRHSGTQWVAAMKIGDDLRDLSKLDSLKAVLRRLGQVIVGHEVVTRQVAFDGVVELIASRWSRRRSQTRRSWPNSRWAAFRVCRQGPWVRSTKASSTLRLDP